MWKEVPSRTFLSNLQGGRFLALRSRGILPTQIIRGTLAQHHKPNVPQRGTHLVKQVEVLLWIWEHGLLKS